MTTEVKLPEYPALALCVVVESRLSLRSELIKDVKSTALFEEIRESQSLATARLTLEMENVDCCVIGSGVSPETVRKLLAWAKGGAKSKDCAFVVLSDSVSPEAFFLSDGAHSQTWRPMTKAKLFDAIVRGVVAANKNSAWTSIFQNSDFHRGFDQDVASPLLIGSARSSVQRSALDAPWELLGMTGAKELSPEAVLKIFREKNLLFGPDGEPTSELRERAEELLSLLVPPSVENERFRQFCRKAVYTWFEDAPLGGFQEATEQLRMRILQFRG